MPHYRRNRAAFPYSFEQRDTGRRGALIQRASINSPEKTKLVDPSLIQPELPSAAVLAVAHFREGTSFASRYLLPITSRQVDEGFLLERRAGQIARAVLLRHMLNFLSRKALKATDAELKLIASAANIGESRIPIDAYNTPAANGTPNAL